MSQSGRPLPARVYRRRRAVVLLGLVAVIVVIIVLIAQPWAGSDETSATAPATATPTAAAPTADASATATPEPTPVGPVDGDPCLPEQITVEAVTDKAVYAFAELPQLSTTIVNTGTNTCTMNVGTTVQVFTITSGSETYWTSTDCQANAADAEVSLAPDTPVSSSTPIVWDRTRSSPDTCEVEGRDSVPAGGASYHLSVAVNGIESAQTKQFILN